MNSFEGGGNDGLTPDPNYKGIGAEAGAFDEAPVYDKHGRLLHKGKIIEGRITSLNKPNQLTKVAKGFVSGFTQRVKARAESGQSSLSLTRPQV